MPKAPYPFGEEVYAATEAVPAEVPVAWFVAAATPAIELDAPTVSSPIFDDDY